MSYWLIVRPAAEADIRNAFLRYETEVPWPVIRRVQRDAFVIDGSGVPVLVEWPVCFPSSAYADDQAALTKPVMRLDITDFKRLDGVRFYPKARAAYL